MDETQNPQTDADAPVVEVPAQTATPSDDATAGTEEETETSAE